MTLKTTIINVILINLLYAACGDSNSLLQTEGPYQATGIKIGEVTDNSAIVWTRLTRRPERVAMGAAMPQILYRDPKTGELTNKPKAMRNLTPVVNFPDGTTIDTIEGAVPGAPGRVRVLYKIKEASDLPAIRNSGQVGWKSTDWKDVEPHRDYTAQFKLTDLKPNVEYQLRIEAIAEGQEKRDERRRKRDERRGKREERRGTRDEERETRDEGRGTSIENGRFRTAPRADEIERVVFTVSTGQDYPDQDVPGGGFKIYPAMLKLEPSFFVHTGDIVYYDQLAKTIELARWHWHRTYSLGTNVEFHRQVASYFIKDDHDTWMNDCWPGMETKFMGDFTFEQGQAVFLEQVPMGERTWRTFRWGKDLQIWLVEGRDFRSPNTMPDGPDKTIWGEQQKAWFKQTVQKSDATFRILISPTPLVGPDRKNKHDNHSNVDFAHEGYELKEFISKQKNMYIICGDRHWQYISVDAKTGVREYSCGPASNEHAGGWSNDEKLPEHRYLDVIGGFLAVIVDRSKDKPAERLAGKPTLTFRHYSVDGNILNEDRLTAQ